MGKNITIQKFRHDLFRLANDPNTNQQILIELSRSEDELIRASVAYNESTPPFVLLELKNDDSEYVIFCLNKRILGDKH